MHVSCHGYWQYWHLEDTQAKATGSTVSPQYSTEPEPIWVSSSLLTSSFSLAVGNLSSPENFLTLLMCILRCPYLVCRPTRRTNSSGISGWRTSSSEFWHTNSTSTMQNLSCQHDELLLQFWLNSGATNWTFEQLLDHGCSYYDFVKFQRRLDFSRTLLYFTGGSIGIISAILALMTFCIQRKEFAAVSFSYHRAINAIELPFMLLMIEHAIRDYTSPSFLNSYPWATFFAKVSGKIDNVLPTSVNVITLFIAVERAVACLAPKQFPIINRPFVVWLVVLGSFVIGTCMWGPSYFAHTLMIDNRSHPIRYMPIWTEFGKAPGFRAYELTKRVFSIIGSILLILATVSAVVGLRRTAARSLQRNTSTRSILANSGAPVPSQPEYWSLLKNLSHLQLCETVPLIFLHTFLVITESIYWDYKGGGKNAPFEITYMEAKGVFSLARARQTSAFCLDVSNVAAHCFHFYWYLIFCPKVRQGFMACVRHGTSGGKNSKPPSNRKCTASDGSDGQKNGKSQPLLANKVENGVAL